MKMKQASDALLQLQGLPQCFRTFYFAAGPPSSGYGPSSRDWQQVCEGLKEEEEEERDGSGHFVKLPR